MWNNVINIINIHSIRTGWLKACVISLFVKLAIWNIPKPREFKDITSYLLISSDLSKQIDLGINLRRWDQSQSILASTTRRTLAF